MQRRTPLPGEFIYVTVNGYVASNASGSLANTAIATSDGEPEGVRDSVTTTVQTAADVTLNLQSTPTAVVGTTATITATVSNIGPSVADGAVVTLTLPAGTSYSSENLPSGWVVASSTGNTVVPTTSNALAACADRGTAGDGEHRPGGADAWDKPAIRRRGRNEHGRPELDQQQC